MSDVHRFPPRAGSAVWIIRETTGAWLVLAHAHGWLFGSHHEALADARWLSRSLDLPIRGLSA